MAGKIPFHYRLRYSLRSPALVGKAPLLFSPVFLIIVLSQSSERRLQTTTPDSSPLFPGDSQRGMPPHGTAFRARRGVLFPRGLQPPSRGGHSLRTARRLLTNFIGEAGRGGRAV